MIRYSLFHRKPIKHSKVFSDINVTPLVDVMLVLLVIFMITAPMIHNEIQVSLPSSSSASKANKENPITIILNKQGVIYVFKQKINKTELASKLKILCKNNKNKDIHIKADKDTIYQKLTDLIDIVKSSGYNNISLVTEQK